MSGAKYIKQAIIASLCEHPDAERYRQRAFSAENLDKVMEAMAQQQQTLTKADFLTPDDDGRFIIDSDSAWKNFDKIVKIVQANGDKFTYEDFIKPLGQFEQRTLLESAWVHKGLGHVFVAENWMGRFDEMERLWYKVPVPNRRGLSAGDGLVPAEVKRRIFQAESKVTPEDRLAKADLSQVDIRGVFAGWRSFEEVNDKLQRAGDHFRKEYVLLTDSSGDTIFEQPRAWDKYDALVRTLRDNGERFEVADFVKQVSFAKNILARAAESKTLNKVFTPGHWEGRLPEMLDLWSRVLEGWKTSPMTTSDFDNAYAEAENLTYTKRFQSLTVAGKADLLRPLNESSETERPVLPLGLKAVWEKFEAVQAALAERGEQLAVADLRTTSGHMGNSCLMSAVKFGHFDKVVGISRQGGGEITIDDFLSKDRHGNTLISVLAEKNQLPAVFVPELWAGRVDDMKTLWAQVSVSQRHQVNFQQAEVNAKQATLKLKKGGFKLQPRQKKSP